MDCDRYREAISARIDGEDPGMADAVLARHLADCGACRTWEAAALAASRRTRLRTAESVPDLTATIMSAFAADAGRARGATARARRRLT